MAKGICATDCIPDICQFWYTATLFRPVKSIPRQNSLNWSKWTTFLPSLCYVWLWLISAMPLSWAFFHVVFPPKKIFPLGWDIRNWWQKTSELRFTTFEMYHGSRFPKISPHLSFIHSVTATFLAHNLSNQTKQTNSCTWNNSDYRKCRMETMRNRWRRRIARGEFNELNGVMRLVDDQCNA